MTIIYNLVISVKFSLLPFIDRSFQSYLLKRETCWNLQAAHFIFPCTTQKSFLETCWFNSMDSVKKIQGQVFIRNIMLQINKFLFHAYILVIFIIYICIFVLVYPICSGFYWRCLRYWYNIKTNLLNRFQGESIVHQSVAQLCAV